MTTDENGQRVYCCIDRNGGMQLRVSRARFNGNEFADLRLWLANGHPTRRGVTVALEDVGQVIGALEELQAA